MLSTIEITSPTIIYQSVAILDNPFSLPHYKPNATKEEHNNQFRLDSHIPPFSLDALPPTTETNDASSADYLAVNKEMTASMGYSSSRSERQYQDTEESKSLHHHNSCPSLPSKKANGVRYHEKRATKSKTRKHKHKSKQSKNDKINKLKLKSSDTEIFGGPKPYFVRNTAHRPDSPFLAKCEDKREIDFSSIVYDKNKKDHPMENSKRRQKKKNTKFLSIVPKKKYHHQIYQKKTVPPAVTRGKSAPNNPFNPFNNKYRIDDDEDDDDDYSVYSESVLYM